MPQRGRPGGNPNITDYAFEQQHSWSEPCSVGKTLRMPPLMAQFIKEGLVENWQEVCRRAIARALPAEKAKQLNWPPQEETKDD